MCLYIIGCSDSMSKGLDSSKIENKLMKVDGGQLFFSLLLLGIYSEGGNANYYVECEANQHFLFIAAI